MSPVPSWFHNAVIEGLQRLYSLSLEGSPSSEALTLTAHAWIESLWQAPIAWGAEPDTPRLREAFLSMSRGCVRWPPPRMLLEHLPKRPELPRLAPPQSGSPTAEQRARLASARKRRHGDQGAPK